MAEAVQQQLEQMVPELEDLERKGLLTSAEVKMVVKKRTQFEYALRRRITQKVDYLRYIAFELGLEELRKQRKVRLGITRTNAPSDFAIVRRVHFIFHKALRKFRSDMQLWLEYFDFCRKTSSSKLLGKAIAMALRSHPQQERLWVMAAKHEFDDNSNVTAARVLLQRGLRMNDASKLLWREYFRLELLFAEKIRARQAILMMEPSSVSASNKKKSSKSKQQQKGQDDELDIDDNDGEEGVALEQLPEEQADGPLVKDPRLAMTTSEDFMSFDTMAEDDDEETDAASALERTLAAKPAATSKSAATPNALASITSNTIPKIVYANAVKAIKDDIDFRLEFVDIYSKFHNVADGIDDVHASLLADLPHAPQTWAVLAQRCIDGLAPVPGQLLSAGISSTTPAKGQQRGKSAATPAVLSAYTSLSPEEQLACATFENGLTKAEAPAAVGVLFAQLLRQRIAMSTGEARDVLLNVLLTLCSSSVERGFASAALFEVWAAVLLALDKATEALHVLEQATVKFPQEVSSWRQYVSLYIRHHRSASSDQVKRLFERAESSVGDKNANELALLHVDALESLQGSTADIVQVFQSALRKTRPGCNELACTYLRWCGTRSDPLILNAAVDFLFTQLGWTANFDVYQCILRLELERPVLDAARMWSLFDRACRVHGAHHHDVWLQAIQLATELGDGERATQLHWKAMKTLRSNRNEFIRLHNLASLRR
ncbi:hypothetical protein CAOG_005466 [Capsaspora owczarzaki ATCC 30864]|uniref:U3 small nucleolar RNA-associated protein 6 n=1 Tax=Capsaspora owczarzaki (strain ATCC 30864) TaxID=595528 RepID=A0A0D2X3U6_CAPO3|nr:hypothetical protein CAOG_005466 [Capsaspora owczarzaki ATCC 30864]